MFLTEQEKINLKQIYSRYKNTRKGFLYYKVIQKILQLISNKNYSIIDIGSRDVDLMSNLDFKERVSLDIECPIYNEKVKALKMDFFDYKEPYKFDIVTCFQVIEHIEKAKEFTQKILKTGNLTIISLPYKWSENTCIYHCQDPIDEEKLYSWTGKKPIFTYYCLDELPRFICIYGNIKYLYRNILGLILLSIQYSKFNLHNKYMYKFYKNLKNLILLIKISNL